jgi:hypothetical protein
VEKLEAKFPEFLKKLDRFLTGLKRRGEAELAASVAKNYRCQARLKLFEK